jgi:Spy/CpxP family protein refolding chaperone
VDTSEAQAHEIEAILIELGGDLFPIREQHRTHRLQLITELSRPQVDAERLEQLRREALQSADLASLELTTALVVMSKVLEPEQRQQLTALATRFGHRKHD